MTVAYKTSVVRDDVFNCQMAADISRAKAEAGEIGRIVGQLIGRYGSPDREGYVYTQKMFDPLKAKLADFGWTYSGAGYFSAVFTKGEAAIKIGLKKEDSGAMYAAWCRVNQGKPGVPRIHAIRREQGCYLVVMDRLRQFDRWRDPQLSAEFEEVCSALYGRVACSEFKTVETARLIREFFNGVAEFDLHDANVMLDRDGNLVITDPVSFSGGKAVANDNPLTLPVRPASRELPLNPRFDAAALARVDWRAPKFLMDEILKPLNFGKFANQMAVNNQP